MKPIGTFVLLLALSCILHAAEKELLYWDLGSPNAMDFKGELWGKYQFKNHAVIMQPGTRLNSVRFPIRKGEIIRVTFDAMSNNLTGEDINVGWNTITYYDESQKPLTHHDLLFISGTKPWKEYQAEFVPPGRAAYFSVDFTHCGSGGTAAYRNIHVYLKDTVAEELIADSDFEDLLGVNYWFYKNNGKDWDGIPFSTGSGKIDQDASDFVTGAKSLRLTGGGATMVSQEFPYHGELLIMSGWIKRSRDFKWGPRWGHAGGGVQLVGLDDNGNHIAHMDLNLDGAPSGWKYYQYENTFPKAVKKVQFFVRDFCGAKGALLVDQLRLRRVPAGVILPFSPAENTLTIDCGKAAEKDINYRVWAGVDALYGHWLLRDDVKQVFPYLKRAGFEMIRFREICCALKMYPNDNPDGTPNYNYEKYDSLMDEVVGNAFIPNITIGTTPHALARPGTAENGWCNNTAPSDMKKWGRFIEAMFRHSVKRYGVEEVNKWYWEIWNEPVVPAERGDYIGSKEDFVAMCEEIYLAAERVEADTPGLRLLMGMTSGGQAGASDEFIFARLKELGKLHLIRHRSRHYYAGISETISMTAARIKEMQEQGSRYGQVSYETGCTEWNVSAMNCPYFNTVWNTAFAVKMVKLFLDNNLNYSTFFAMVDHPEMPGPQEIFAVSMGLFTRTNDYRNNGAGTLKPITRPVYNAFLLLNELKTGKRLTVRQTAEPADAIAVVMPGGNIRVLVTNYDEDTGRQPYLTKVTLNFTGAEGKTYTCIRNLACDEENGNSFGEWIKMGKPTIHDRKAPELIQKKAFPVDLKLPQVKKTADGFSVAIDLPSPGIRLLEFKPE